MTQKLDTHKIKGLIFDLDGTLADTMSLHLEAWNEVGSKYGLALSAQDNQDTAGMPTVEIVKLFNKKRNLSINPVQFMEEKENCFINNKLPNIKPIAAVAQFVYDLHGNYPMAIGTGSNKELADKVLNTLSMTKYFKSVATADDVQNHKPAPDTFLKAAKDMGIAPENCVVFEDSKLGIKAALDGGMQAVDILETTDEELLSLLKELKSK